jgi:hypothetical protein
MILNALDTPLALSQVRACPLDPDALEDFRAALQDVVERGDTQAMKVLWRSVERPFVKQFGQVRSRVDVEQVKAFAARVAKLVKTLEVRLPKAKFIDAQPDVWATIAAGVANLESISELPAVIAKSRLDTLVKAFSSLQGGDSARKVPRADVGDVAWVKSVVLDGGKLVSAPKEAKLGEGEQTTATVLEAVRARVDAPTVLLALVGAWRSSQGPGPFLTEVTGAQPLELATWKRLPLFEAAPFCEMSVLEGSALLAAKKQALAAKPSRPDEVPANEWKSLVSAHWPRCRDRFVALLDEAHAKHQAVLLCENDRRHPMWLEGTFTRVEVA